MLSEIHSVWVNSWLKGVDAVVVLMTVFVYGIKFDLAHPVVPIASFLYIMWEDDLYATLVYLITAPIPVCTLINLYIALLLAASAVLVKLFLGHLMPSEIHSVLVNFSKGV